MDSDVDVTSRVHIQVSGDYMIVNAWADEMTMKSWPARQSMVKVIEDVKAAIEQFAEAVC